VDSFENIKRLVQDLKFLYLQSDESTKTDSLEILKDLLDEIAPNRQNQTQSLLKQKLDIINEYMFTTTSDLNGKILDISQAYLDFTGYTREEVIGKNHKIFRNQDIDKNIIKNLWDTLSKDKIYKGELKNSKSTGEEYWIAVNIKPFYDDNGVKIGYLSIIEDITTKKRFQELSNKDALTLFYNKRQFEQSIKRDFLKATSQHQSIALMIVQIDYFQEYSAHYGKIQASKLIVEIADMLKLQLPKQIGEIFKISDAKFAIIILNRENSFIQNLAATLLDFTRSLKIQNSQSKASKYVTISIGLINLETNEFTINSHDFYNIADANLSKATEGGADQVVWDISEKYVQNLKDIDTITKLPNRISLINYLGVLQEEAMLIILHMNQLNSLKELYGFKFASDILSQKAQELKSIINSNEATLYNLNLHEFAILVTNKSMFEKYFLILKHSILITDCPEEYITSNYVNADFTAGISYGVQNIFNHADLVLQEALASKISYKIYKNNHSAKQLQEDNFHRLKVYKNALHRGKIIPYFQPIVDAKDGTLIKYEALARLQTNDGEIISPYLFLDSAHEDKTFEFFTRQMMQKVFNIFSKNSVALSINLNYQNINSQTMVEYIQNRLEKYGGDGITFEILETENILDYSVMETFITMVKTYGCKISVDDFGSGYSNFTNIIKLDIDYIKIDGSLIEKLNSDANVKHMVQGLVLFAKNTKMKTIAEFVSTQELADTVKEIGIDYIQGYFYGEPKPPEFYQLLS